jgi:hypothetical protein
MAGPSTFLDVDNSEKADIKEEMCFDADSEQLGEKTAKRVTVKMSLNGGENLLGIPYVINT